MGKRLLSGMALLFCASFLLCQTVLAAENTFVGRIYWLTPTSLFNGLTCQSVENCEMKVCSDQSRYKLFTVKDAVITDANGKILPTNLANLKKGEKVEIKYMQGTAKILKIIHKKAISIHYLNFETTSTQPELTTTVSATSSTTSEISANSGKTFKGTIEKSTPLLGLKGYSGVYNELKVATNNGEIVTIYVTRNTVITDEAGNNISGKRGRINKRVEIKYYILECNKYAAISIRYLD